MPVVERLKDVSEKTASDLTELARALHEDDRTATVADVQKIIGGRNAALMVVKDGGKIVGMGTLYIIPKIGKKNAYIEDVIVDSAYRGKGLGEKLTSALIEYARAEGVASISLTSRLHRIPAHTLYQKLGFKQKETNVFQLRF